MFPKICEPPQNSRRQNGDVKQVPYLGYTNTRRSRTKFCHLRDVGTPHVAYEVVLAVGLPVFCGLFLDFLTLEDGTDRLFGNVGLPFDAA
jgi:hypothetical protein